MMRLFLAALTFAVAVLPAWCDEPRGLQIWFIDTEGGAATLIVTPARESILIDSGHPGKRDAEAIHRVATERAKLTAIDHHIITHWHLDHYGGIERLVQLMPVKKFYHHGIPDKLEEDPRNFPVLIKALRQAAKGQDVTLKPGDLFPLKQVEGAPKLEMLCVCGSGEVIPDREGAPENPIAKEHKPHPEDRSDNARSLGFVLKFGGFRFLDLGDLTWNIEYKLVHPTDKIGPVDVYQVSHHGLEVSNNPVLIKTVQPRVAVFNNGPRKGGHPSVLATLRRLPETPAIYQLHRNLNSAANENTDPQFIANDSANCKAEPIWIDVAPDARTYTVTVGGTNFTRKYETRLKEETKR